MKSAFEESVRPCHRTERRLSICVIREVEGIRGGSSDHDSYIARGVPGFFWRQDGRAKYFETWHTTNDFYEAAIPEYQAHSSLVIALTAYGMSELDELLSREKMQAPRRVRRVMGVQLGERTASLSTA